MQYEEFLYSMTFSDSVLFGRTVVISKFDLFHAGQMLKRADLSEVFISGVRGFGSVDTAEVRLFFI